MSADNVDSLYVILVEWQLTQKEADAFFEFFTFDEFDESQEAKKLMIK